MSKKTTEYGMRNVVANLVLQRFSFTLIGQNDIQVIIDIGDKVTWQAGHTGDHRMLLLVGEVSPIPTETMINHRATLPLGLMKSQGSLTLIL